MSSESTLIAAFIAIALIQGPVAAQADAQSGENLLPEIRVGSKAPQMDLAHWLQVDDARPVTPVTQFQSDRVYVLEFWATTCGPCIRGMPHLSELQAKMASDVRIICISDEQPDVIESFLSKPLAESGMAFSESIIHLTLAADPDRSVYRAYMDAAGEPGIPTSFIVGRTGFIEWIGHADKIDGPLTQVIDDEWDRNKFAAEYAAVKSVRDAYYLGAIHGRFDEAREQLWQIRRGNESRTIEQLINRYLSILEITEVKRAVFKDDGRAPSMIRKHFKEQDISYAVDWLTNVASATEHQQFSLPVLEAMIDLARDTAERSPDSPILLDSLAVLLTQSGRIDEAIAAQEEAVQASTEVTDRLTQRLNQLRNRRQKGEAVTP